MTHDSASGNTQRQELHDQHIFTIDHLQLRRARPDKPNIAAGSTSFDSSAGVTTATETVSNPFRYKSGYEDSTGFYHFGARYYDPTNGRWTQIDPSGQNSGYLYAEDEPITSSDISDYCDSISGCLSLVALRMP